MNDEKTLALFQDVETALAPAPGAVAEDLCTVYRRIKGPAEALLPIIELIPIYGKTIANLIRTLLKIAESFCGGN